jgi:hypothetical protein
MRDFWFIGIVGLIEFVKATRLKNQNRSILTILYYNKAKRTYYDT